MKKIKRVSHVVTWGKNIQGERITKSPKAATPSILKEVSSGKHDDARSKHARRESERKSGQR